MNQTVFVFAVAIFAAALAGIAGFFILRARRASSNAWTALMDRLQRIDRETFALIALDLLEEPTTQLDPDQIFEMIGGMDGLAALEHNCGVLIDLATYVQRWYPEALHLSEELRLNAREIQWHIDRLRSAKQTGHLRDQFPMYAQRAVATYYLMTRSLLVLYEGVELPEFADLQRAI